MKSRLDDGMDSISARETDGRQASADADEAREVWTRPRLSRLSTRSTAANPTFGADGGGAFLAAS